MDPLGQEPRVSESEARFGPVGRPVLVAAPGLLSCEGLQ